MAEWKEVLRAFHGLTEPTKKFLQVLVTFDEIDLRSVHNEQIGSRIAEKEMFVSVAHGLQIFR